MPILMPTTNLSRRGVLIANAMRERRLRFDVLCRRAHVRPARMRDVMQGADWVALELPQVAQVLQMDLRDLVQP